MSRENVNPAGDCGQPAANLSGLLPSGRPSRRQCGPLGMTANGGGTSPGGASPPQGPSSTGRSPSWDPFADAHPIRQGLAVVVASPVLVPNLPRLNVPAAVVALGHQVLGDVIVRQLVAVVGYTRAPPGLRIALLYGSARLGPA